MRLISNRALIAGALIAVAVLGQTGADQARAGGVFLYETGTPDMFTGGAGWAARAQDAATVLTNPAGMARLDGGDLIVGAGALYGDIEFTAHENTTTDGGGGGTAVGWLPNGGVYFARPATDSFWFGIAATSNFGLTLTYDDDWVGRYYATESTLIGISVLPSVAWRMSPQLSFGLSLNVMYGAVGHDAAINNLGPTQPDGMLSFSAGDMGFGANLGLLWEPTESSRVGVTYTSPVNFEFSDRPDFTGLGPGIEAALRNAGLLDVDLGIDVTVPQTVMVSFYHDVNEAFALLGDVGWQDWSAFGGVDVMVANDPPTELSIELPYKDTWRGAIGGKWKPATAWLLSAGVGYDSAMVEDADRTVGLPVGATWRFAVGGQRDFGERFDLGCGYTFLAMGDVTVDQERGNLPGRVSGTYEGAGIHFLSLQGHWKF